MFRMIQGPTVLLASGLWVLAVGASAQGLQARGAVKLTAAQVAALAPGQTAASTTPLAALNQVTIADLVAGFQQFLGQAGQAGLVGQTATAGLQSGLTPEQQQLIQGLQSQLDGEEINEEAFANQVQGVVGNGVSSQSFGVLGTLPAQQPTAETSDPLNLTAQQQQLAQDIATRLHDDIALLRQNAHDLIFSVLTPDQQALLTGSSQDQAAQPAPAAQPAQAAQAAQPAQTSTAKARSKVGKGMGLRSQGTTAGATIGGTTAVAQGTASGVGEQSAGAAGAWQNPFDALQLSDAQKAQIELIRSDLRAAVQARHQQARDEFFALLTPEQQALLYQLEQASAESAGSQ